ncbi:hypothetical protein Clacol_008644 [Clathrus columnatus]|uniref:Uncharacterized protein n=1 Tax=Clathrus columnatus TaxID=1419009 RepID=A0AAV5AR77_9AGAM|nr:hypothetical protein Clacol_008644 [Clathrus columnatus]
MTAHSQTVSQAHTAGVDSTTPLTEEEYRSQVAHISQKVETLTLENNAKPNDSRPVKYLPGLTPFPESLKDQNYGYLDEDGLDWRADDYPVESMLRNASRIFTPANGFNADEFMASMQEFINNMPYSDQGSLPILPPSPEPSYLSCGDEDARTPGYEEPGFSWHVNETCTDMENLSLTDVEMSE